MTKNSFFNSLNFTPISKKVIFYHKKIVQSYCKTKKRIYLCSANAEVAQLIEQ